MIRERDGENGSTSRGLKNNYQLNLTYQDVDSLDEKNTVNNHNNHNNVFLNDQRDYPGQAAAFHPNMHSNMYGGFGRPYSNIVKSPI